MNPRQRLALTWNRYAGEPRPAVPAVVAAGVLDLEACQLPLQARMIAADRSGERMARTFAEYDAARAAIAPPMHANRLYPTLVCDGPLPLNASDGEIRRAAAEHAGRCLIICCETPDDWSALARCRAVCHAVGIAPPEAKRPDAPVEPLLRRMACSRWWRRRLRVYVTRRNEAERIAAGVVHRRAECYVTDAAVERRREAAARNERAMASTFLVNDSGEVASVFDLAASSATPEKKRAELMTRVKGLEAIADQRGEVGYFLTISLASKFHARIAATGLRNPKHDGATPRDGQAELVGQWARARALLAKKKIAMYGLRVAEPHHDATPHWHLMIWTPREHRRAVLKVLRAEAMRIDPDEIGAAKHRFKLEIISKAKGGAVSYLAKYLAKAIDGHQLEFATEQGADGQKYVNGDGATAAERVRTWASAWGIRQFQFFGTPAVGLWRELRRLREPCAVPVIEAAREPADAGDYAAHVVAVGGVLTPKARRPVTLNRETPADPTRYGDDPAPRVKGVAELLDVIAKRLVWKLRALKRDGRALVRASRKTLFERLSVAGRAVRTRLTEWTQLDRHAAELWNPRTRVNNCNHNPAPQGAHLEQASWITTPQAPQLSRIPARFLRPDPL